MSAIIIPGTLVPARAIGQSDTRTPVIAGTIERPGISCDTESDLPGTQDFAGYELVQESYAHVIAGNKKFCMKSGGIWEEQQESPFADVYTKSEVDILLSNINNDIGLIQSDITDLQQNIADLIDTGSKNIMNNTAVTGEHNNVLFTVNPDLSVTLSGGAASAYYSFRIAGDQSDTSYAMQIPIPPGTYILTGLGGNASALTYRYILGLRTASDQTRVSTSIYEDYEFTVTTETTRFDLAIYTATGAEYNNPTITVYPMILPKWKWMITQKYLPYSPSNAELAAMIRRYHT